MNQYLLDTNIAIFYMKGKFNLDKKFETLSVDDCYISEITLAELKFGIAKSEQRERNTQVLEKFLTGVRVLPISEAVDLYAEEKARLQKMGMRLDDFDLLIGVTAVVHRLTLVTNNTKHFERIGSIALEDWTIE
ncbi:MAG: type II toxin-antitoxin system VapC family toxin [Candidatus Kapaibacteriota bacterium]